MNAYKNIYFPPATDDAYVDMLLNTAHEYHDTYQFRRLESVDGTDVYRATEKDEFAPPSPDVQSELVQFSARGIPISIKPPKVRIRERAKNRSNDSAMSPIRDPAWLSITKDFAGRVEKKEINFDHFWKFAQEHPLISDVGSWIRRLYN